MGGLVGCGCVVVGQVCISVVGDLVGGLGEDLRWANNQRKALLTTM